MSNICCLPGRAGGFPLGDNEFSPSVPDANFFIDILQVVNSQIIKIATIDKSSFAGGRNYKLDLAPYKLTETETLIGLRYEVFPSKHPWPWLGLFRIKDGKLTCVLEIDMEGHDYDWTENGEDNIRNILFRRIAISKNKTNKCFDIVSYANIDGKNQKPQIIKWNGLRYVVPDNFIGNSNCVPCLNNPK